MKYIWLIAAAVMLVSVNAVAAAREYTLYGSISVFCLLTLLSLAVIALTGRAFTAALLISGVLAGLNYADGIKYHELRQHLHHQDAGIILQFVRDFDFGFFQKYQSTAFPAFFATMAAMLIFCLSWRYERHLPATLRARFFSGLLLAGMAAIAWLLFANSQYMLAVRSQLPPRVSADRAPIRISATLAGITESVTLSNILADDRKAAPISPATPMRPCGTCPDIIIVHLESVYDPQFEAAFAKMPSLGELVGGKLEKWNSLIRVHTWGGNSVVTEFELLCSVNHELFGWGGLQPHTNVSPFFRGCLGNELKSLGYENHVLYSLNGSFSGVRTAFERYGFDKFRDFSSLNLPKKWSELHDRLIYQQLFTSMSEPRERPRSYFISTNWNHGPHGLQPIEAHYPGPYTPSQASSPALADYVNRLNDSISGLDEIAEYVAAASYPVVVLAYGDHHPAFVKNYSEAVTDEFQDPDYMTPLIMFRNFGGASVEPKRAITVEETAYYLSKFAGIAPLDRVEQIHAVQLHCGGDQKDCSEADRRTLRSIHLDR